MANATAKTREDQKPGKDVFASSRVSNVFDNIRNLSLDEIPIQRVSLGDICIDLDANVRSIDSPKYSEDSIGNLAEQIIEAGHVLVPLWILQVHPSEANQHKDFVLISGFRRSLASREAYKRTEDDKYIRQIDARIFPKGTPVESIKALQLLENIREDLDLIEIGNSIADVVGPDNLEFAKKYGKKINIPTRKVVAAYNIATKFSSDVVKAIKEGNISESNAVLIASEDYKIKSEDLPRWSKAASRLSYKSLKESLDRTYKSNSNTAASNGKGKPKIEIKPISKKEARDMLAPFIKKQKNTLNNVPTVEEAAPESKERVREMTEAKYSEVELNRALIRTLELSLGFGGKSISDSKESEIDIQLLKDYKKFVEKEEVKAEKEKESKKIETSKSKFVRKNVTKLKKMLDQFEDIEEGKRKYPGVKDALKAMFDEWKSMSEKEIDELGFELGPDERKELINEVGVAYTKKVKEAAKNKSKGKKNNSIKEREKLEAPTVEL